MMRLAADKQGKQILHPGSLLAGGKLTGSQVGVSQCAGTSQPWFCATQVVTASIQLCPRRLQGLLQPVNSPRKEQVTEEEFPEIIIGKVDSDVGMGQVHCGRLQLLRLYNRSPCQEKEVPGQSAAIQVECEGPWGDNTGQSRVCNVKLPSKDKHPQDKGL